MMLQYKVLALILLDVILNVVGQLSLKRGMAQFGTVAISLATLPHVFFKSAVNLYVLAGLACYVMGFLVWLIVLAKAEVSYAYPLISLGYVFTAILAWLLFNEAMTDIRIAGILLICIGVYLIARSYQPICR